MRLKYYSNKVHPFIDQKHLVLSTKKYFILIGLRGFAWRLKLWDQWIKEGAVGPIRYGRYDFIPF